MYVYVLLARHMLLLTKLGYSTAWLGGICSGPSVCAVCIGITRQYDKILYDSEELTWTGKLTGVSLV